MALPALSPPGSRPLVSVRAVRGPDGGGLILTLDAEVELDRLRAELLRVLGQTPDRWRNQSARLDLGERDLELFDVRRLVHLLREEFGLAVVGIYSTGRALQRFVARELKLQVYLREAEAERGEVELTEDRPAAPAGEEDPTRPAGEVDVIVLDELGDYEDSPGWTALTEQAPGPAREDEDAPTVVLEPLPGMVEDPADPGEPVSLPVQPAPLAGVAALLGGGGRRVLSLRRTVRGGQRVAFPGDVLVFGDVNPGAAIEAGGNILVLGRLRGLAHAGAHGDARAVILAFELRPTQVRIAGCIAIPGPERAGRGFQPELAWVSGERILIEDYTGRLPGPLTAEAADSPRRDP